MIGATTGHLLVTSVLWFSTVLSACSKIELFFPELSGICFQSVVNEWNSLPKARCTDNGIVSHCVSGLLLIALHLYGFTMGNKFPGPLSFHLKNGGCYRWNACAPPSHFEI
jgi:hypothetical protein